MAKRKSQSGKGKSAKRSAGQTRKTKPVARAKGARKPAGGGTVGIRAVGVSAASIPGPISGIPAASVGDTVDKFIRFDEVEELHVVEDAPDSFTVTPMRAGGVVHVSVAMPRPGSKVPGPVTGVSANAVGRTVDAFIRFDDVIELHVDETSSSRFTVTPLRVRRGGGSASVASVKPGPKRARGTSEVAERGSDVATMAEEMVAELAPDAKTVVYIHGINNKPPASILKCQWDTALFGQEMGDSTRMAYWVNREYYPVPSPGNCGTGDTNDTDTSALATFGVRALESEPTLIEEIQSLAPASAEQAKALAKIAAKVEAAALTSPASIPGDTPPEPGEVRARLLPLPESWRRWLTQRITRRFLRDVNDFLFVPERRELMEQSLRERLLVGGGPFVVVSHSQGTMIAYEVLRKLTKEQADVRLFVTMGSPLGIQEVQDQLRKWAGGRLRVPQSVTTWINVNDRLDPVAADADISNDYEPKGAIKNYSRPFMNPDSPKDPHSGSGYLRTAPVQHAVRAAAGTNFGQAVRNFVIARDLAAELEDAHPQARQEVLIQLVQPESSRELDRYRSELVAAIRSVVPEDQHADAGIEPLQRFVSAMLTRSEVERLRTRNKEYRISTVWRDAAKRALINKSGHTIQARPASLGYGARGQDVCWAVLDTGIRADHPHFDLFQNIERQWNCVLPGPLDPRDPDKTRAPDGHGHGTHVAGIIAGQFRAVDERRVPSDYVGMAPEARLHVYKVLDDRGVGSDSRIIKALDHIADTNERAGQLIIHGVNLSLGGAFDPSVFGCGHSPLCQELRRLWRQGLVVCVAAGNEGYLALESAEGEINVNADLSVGDPANLEECIAVGSVHKLNPHTYGVSYFSSRGPTADGRFKPDCVAPGEKIYSACHRFDRANLVRGVDPPAADVYIEMSGTSMATPHVSGVLAAYLSMRREFIGYPDKVKKVLLDHCTDLGRDRYMQGAGMPNLIKMLINS